MKKKFISSSSLERAFSLLVWARAWLLFLLGRLASSAAQLFLLGRFLLERFSLGLALPVRPGLCLWLLLLWFCLCLHLLPVRLVGRLLLGRVRELEQRVARRERYPLQRWLLWACVRAFWAGRRQRHRRMQRRQLLSWRVHDARERVAAEAPAVCTVR